MDMKYYYCRLATGGIQACDFRTWQQSSIAQQNDSSFSGGKIPEEIVSL